MAVVPLSFLLYFWDMLLLAFRTLFPREKVRKVKRNVLPMPKRTQKSQIENWPSVTSTCRHNPARRNARSDWIITTSQLIRLQLFLLFPLFPLRPRCPLCSLCSLCLLCLLFVLFSVVSPMSTICTISTTTTTTTTTTATTTTTTTTTVTWKTGRVGSIVLSKGRPELFYTKFTGLTTSVLARAVKAKVEVMVSQGIKRGVRHIRGSPSSSDHVGIFVCLGNLYGD